MDMLTRAKGIGSLSRHPQKIVFLVVYIVVCTWLISHAWSKRAEEQSSDIIFPRMLSQFQVPSTKRIDANKTTEIQSKHIEETVGSEQGHDSEVKQKVKISRIGQFDVHQRQKSHTRHKCSMEKYLKVAKSHCNPILNAISNEVTEYNNRNWRNAMANGGVFNVPTVNNRKYTLCDINGVFYRCDELRYSYLYGKDSVTDEERNFPLAFAMKVHKADNQAHRLLRYIYQEHNYYCIHVDAKAPVTLFTKFKQIAKCFDNIHIIEDRVNVVYSSIKQVDAEFKCMEAMIKHGHNWKYYINLTGQEFMLRTNLEIVKILKLLNGTNEIESSKIPVDQVHKYKQKTFVRQRHAFLSKQKKEPFSINIELRKGSAYGMFSRKFVEFLLTDDFVKKFYEWLKDAYAPEELIWPTLNNMVGTPGGRIGIYHGSSFLSRAVKWSSDKSEQCGGRYVHYVCIYGIRDVPWLLRHNNVVANKFYEDYHPHALDCVENEMYTRLISGRPSVNFDLTYYKKIVDRRR